MDVCGPSAKLGCVSSSKVGLNPDNWGRLVGHCTTLKDCLLPSHHSNIPLLFILLLAYCMYVYDTTDSCCLVGHGWTLKDCLLPSYHSNIAVLFILSLHTCI